MIEWHVMFLKVAIHFGKKYMVGIYTYCIYASTIFGDFSKLISSFYDLMTKSKTKNGDVSMHLIARQISL